MAERSDNRQRARELWEQSGGTMPLKDIAEQLGVSASTVRNWKARDGWGQASATRDASRKHATRRDTNRKRKARVNACMTQALEAVEALSDVEKDFCLHFVSCYNATQAAWRTGAYSTLGSANTNGWKMLQKEIVQNEIQRLKVMKRAAILADVDDLVELHMRIAFSSIKDFVVWTYDPLTRSNRMAVLPSSTVDGQMVQEISESAQGFKIKMRDAKDSMAFLDRYFEANPMDKHKKQFDAAKLKLENDRLKIEQAKAAAIDDVDDDETGVVILPPVMEDKDASSDTKSDDQARNMEPAT